MTIKIGVLIKQVPDPEHFGKITINLKTKAIVRDGFPLVLNPLDRYAIEEALCLQEKNGAVVTAITMGPPQSVVVLEEALAMGVNDAVLLCDPRFAVADTLATAEVLATAVTKLGGFDLIICGNESADGGTSQVPAQVAELLDWTLATSVDELTIDENRIVSARRDLGRFQAFIELDCPAVISVVKTSHVPRYFSVWNIVRVTETVIKIYNAGDLGVEPSKIGPKGSPTQVINWYKQDDKNSKGSLILTGQASTAAWQAVRKLAEMGAIR